MTSGSDFETSSGWAVEFCTGSAQFLHDAEPDFSRRLVRVNSVTSTALVLGSTQSPELIDSVAAGRVGTEIAHRRSGGGVVSMQPGAQCWVDVFLPVNDPLWVDDVTHSSIWLGNCWAEVARSYGWDSPEVHRGRISNPRLSRLICFAALGPGEVSHGSTKLVGISQRRTRHGAKFQCIAYTAWDPSSILDLVQLGSDAEEIARTLVQNVAALPFHEESPCATSVPPGSPAGSKLAETGWSTVERLLSRLP